MKTLLTVASLATLLVSASAYALPPINGGDTTPFGKSAQPAPAPAPEPVKNPFVFDDWAISLNGKASNPSSCVAFSDAKSKGGGKRGPARLTITQTPGQVPDTFTILQGYNMPAGTTGTLEVDGKSFKLIADKDALWAEKPEDDKPIVAALKAGSTAKVVAAGVTDSYSLTGLSGAYDAIHEKCK